MSEFIKQNAEATEQYLSFLAQTQEQILDGVRKAPVYNAPEFPAFAGAEATAPAAFTQELPSARELTEAAFNFTEKLIAQQKSFMERYFDVAEAKVNEVESKAQPAAAATAAQATAAATAPAKAAAEATK